MKLEKRRKKQNQIQYDQSIQISNWEKDSKRGKKDSGSQYHHSSHAPSDKSAADEAQSKLRPQPELRGKPAKVKGQDAEHPKDHNGIETVFFQASQINRNKLFERE